MHDIYQNPLCERYASRQMQAIFSDDKKFTTWRKLWVALAEAEKELGLPIEDEQIEEMKRHINDIDYDLVRKKELEIRHDVMAHIFAFGEACPKAKPIIHLGATSCFVGDNTDLIIQKEALELIRKKLVYCIYALSQFVEQYQGLETLAYTHFQAAQPTTLGKRGAMWLQDFMMDMEHLDFVLSNLKFHGCRGTTGTGASFLSLWNGDKEKVKELENKIAHKMGFASVYSISGQTYTRKVDYYTLSILSGIAQSAMKFSGDIRLLSHLKEVDEPFEDGQVGSSAMAYKRNPMRSERITSLARYVIVDGMNASFTHGTQWLERTLDDSANRRISLPEAFLAVDGILTLVINVIQGLKVYPLVMKKHLDEELPFMITENILMVCTKRGGDRQELHEAIRKHSIEAGKRVKLEGKENDLLDRIIQDPLFGLTKIDVDTIIKESHLSGLAEEQVQQYLKEVKQFLKENEDVLSSKLDTKISV